MRFKIMIPVVFMSITSTLVHAEDKASLKDESARINYSLGYQIGNDFKQQNVKLDKEALVKGIEDALAGGKPLMDPAEMHTTLVELKRKVVEDQQARLRKSEATNIEADKQYVEKFLNEEGVKTTESGLIYKIIAPGNDNKPKATDSVTVNYRGTLANGNEFDSSYKRGKPSQFTLKHVIKGWTEGLQLIGEGGKIMLVVPPKLAYGERGPLAHRTLIFDVELISVGKQPTAQDNNKKQVKGQ